MLDRFRKTKFVPDAETVEIMETDLKTIYDQLSQKTLEELIEAPAEYVIKGSVKMADLRLVQSLPVEVGIAGEKGRLVLNTGTAEKASLEVGDDDISDRLHFLSERALPDNSIARMAVVLWNKKTHYRELLPVSAKARLINSSYTAHSHPGGEEYADPSEGDLAIVSRSKSKSSILIDATGVTIFSFPDRTKATINEWFAYMSAHPQGRDNDYDQLWRNFIQKHGSWRHASWDDQEEGQKILDDYFDQSE